MNTGKQINAMVVVLFLTLITVGIYTIWDPFRSDAAKTEQVEQSAEFGAETFTLNCRLCHGDRGEGGQAGGRLLAAPELDRPEFMGIKDGAFSQALFDTNRLFVRNTIMCGRAGTAMPTWGASQGGTLSDEQIQQLVVLITEGDWELAQEHADDVDADATNDATLDMPDGLTADATQVTLSNAGAITLGQYIRIGEERMRVLPKQLEVQRAANGTEAAEHPRGASVLRNGAPVLSAGTPELRNAAAVIVSGAPVVLAELVADDATALVVSDTAPFAVGDTLQVEDETVVVTGISRGITTTDRVLVKDIGRTPKTLLVSGPEGFQEGALIRIDSELMSVTAASNDGDSGAELDTDVTAGDATISVDKPTFFRPDYEVFIGDEMMKVLGPVDTGQTLAESIGTAQTEIDVSGTAEIPEGMIIRMDDELFRVTEIVQLARIDIERGVNDTTAATHGAGAAILEVVEPPAEGQPAEDPTTGQALIANITVDATTADVTGTSRLAIGQQYTLDGETVEITDIEPAVLKVQRAVGGTKKAEHSRRVAIYDSNRLAVERGVNSSAAGHSAGDAVEMTAVRVKREVEDSKVAEHAKGTEVFLGNDLIVARGVLETDAAEHTDGSPVLNFVAPPDEPATNPGPTCSQPAVEAGPTGPTATPIEGAIPVEVVLDEFTVEPDPDSVGQGGVQFNVSNEGAGPHNFRVVQTDLEPDQLPLSGSSVDENAVNVVARSAPSISAGGTESVAATLTAGDYVLICNVPTHYESGMYVSFTVQ